MNKLNSKNWQRVRVSRKNKTITFTNSDTYHTKSECEKDINSAQYIAINKRNLNKMITEGYAIAGQEKHATKPQKATQQLDLTGDPDIERQIAEYEKKQTEKIEREIEQYVINKQKRDALKSFFTVKQPAKVEPINYSKRWDKFEKTGRPKALKAKAEQVESYCN